MLPPDRAKARVIDIRDPRVRPPSRIVADANVLYLIYYDFHALIAAGGHAPPHYQVNFYPAWWELALEANIELSTSAGCLLEFAHIAERTELEVFW